MGPLKISTEIDSIALITGEEKAVEYVAKAGFDAWDFTMNRMCRYVWKTGEIFKDHILSGKDYLPFVRRLRRVAEDNGIVCNQSHAPFPINEPEIRDYCKRAIECTAEVGGEICVIHPDSLVSVEENAAFYHELLPFAKSCRVKIATENMFLWNRDKDCAAPAACSDPAGFLKQLQAVNDDHFVACLDIGHAELNGLGTSAVEMIRALGPYLQCLHIHDNDKCRDRHQIPFSMNIDFDGVVKALKECGYKGYLTLEAGNFLKEYNEETVLDGVRQMAAAARRLSDMLDAC